MFLSTPESSNGRIVQHLRRHPAGRGFGYGYSRMIRRDWYGQDLGPGNNTARIKYWIEGEGCEEGTKKEDIWRLRIGILWQYILGPRKIYVWD